MRWTDTILATLCAVPMSGPILAQPAEFDPADFGRIVIAERQSSDGVTFEQAFGDYQNEPIIAYGEDSPAVRLGRPIGRLDLLFGDGKPGFCTAFIVDERHIVTNHHCVPGMDGDPTGADMNLTAAQFVAGYILPGRAEGADRYAVATEIVETNRALDYTVLRVYGDPSAKYGRLALADGDADPGEFLWIIGHPEGQSQHISREGCAAATPAISPEGKLVHTCDTLRGNSGSPVIRISDQRVVGLHHAGDNRTGFNLAIPMRIILAQSTVLSAAPVAVVAAAPVPDACTVLWGEARTLGCDGHRVFLSQCGDHLFADLARSILAAQCTPEAPVVAVPDSDRPTIASHVDVPAHSGPVLVVAPAGGDYSDLGAAIRAAQPGTRITLEPGTYPVSATLAKPVEIVGTGAPGSVVLTGAGGSLVVWEAPSGRIANVTLRQDDEDPALEFSDGTATVMGLTIDAAGTGIAIYGDSSPTIEGNLIRARTAGIVIADAAARPVISGNDISAPVGSAIEVFGAAPDIIANTLHDALYHAIYIEGEMPGRIEGNTIFDIGESDIHRE